MGSWCWKCIPQSFHRGNAGICWRLWLKWENSKETSCLFVIVRALYGLRTSGVQWHKRLDNILHEMGFFPCKANAIASHFSTNHIFWPIKPASMIFACSSRANLLLAPPVQ
jgi:hypothetical protein